MLLCIQSYDYKMDVRKFFCEEIKKYLQWMYNMNIICGRFFWQQKFEVSGVYVQFIQIGDLFVKCKLQSFKKL